MMDVKVTHSLSVLAMLAEMKRRRFVCDYSIKVKEEVIPVHRVVLAASSDYFVQLFSLRKDEALGCTELNDLDPQAVSTCIDFMYSGSAYVDMGTIRAVMQAAITLELRVLVEICIRYLEDSISLSSCFQVREIANEYDILSLVCAAERFAVQNFDLVIRSKGFHDLSSFAIMDFLKSATSYVQKWEAATTWVLVNTEERRSFLSDMLKMIISDKCSFHFIYEKMLFHSLVENSTNLSIIVAEGLFKAMAPFDVCLRNCFDLLQVARTFEGHCPKEVLRSIRDFVAANFDSICHTDGFRALDEVDFLAILSSENSHIYPATTKWTAAINWVKSDLQRRKARLVEVLRIIDWTHCSTEAFLDHVNGNLLIRRSKDCAFSAASILFSIMKDFDINRLNWFLLLTIAENHETEYSQSAKEKILLFASANFADICKQNNFSKLGIEDVANVISHTVKTSSPEVQWDAILKWVNRDIKSRKGDLFRLLSSTNLWEWKFSFVYECVYPNDLVQESHDCCYLVTSALLSGLKEGDLGIQDSFELLSIGKRSQCEFSDQAVGRIRRFFAKNYEKVSAQTSDFVALEGEDVYAILDSEEFKACSEDLKWTSIFGWITADVSRQECLRDILEKLELNEFSFRFLDTRIYSQDSIRSDSECQKICVSAMLSNLRYHDISIVNWFDLLQLAKTHEHKNIQQILAKINQFMASNFSHIQKQAHFAKLEKEEILFMVKSPEIVNVNPEEQLHGVYEWLRGDYQREKEAPGLLSSLDLEKFPLELLFTNLLHEPLIKEYAVNTGIFLSAMQSSLHISHVNMENWYPLLKIVKNNEREKYTKLFQTLLKFIATKFGTVSHQSQFKHIESDDFWAVFRLPELVASETIKAKSVMLWAKADENGRSPEVPKLLQLVKLEDVPNTYLRSMHADPLISNSVQCKDMILEALFAKDQNEDSRAHMVDIDS